MNTTFRAGTLPDNVAIHPTAFRRRASDKAPEQGRPMVSVALITYNHGAYIAKALDSVFEQQCDFEFEVVVGDDCSTDATRAIVEVYMRQYPGRIRLLDRDTNLGSQRNVAETMRACHGHYIAYLDGDDYWTHPGKLQRQYQALRDNPASPLVFHNSRMLYEHCKPGLLSPPRRRQREHYGLRHILERNFIAAQSVMVRREAVQWIPDWLFEHPDIPWDWPFFIECARRGELLYINETMCAYRIHPQGLWSGQTAEVRLRAISSMFAEVQQELPPLYRFTLVRLKLKLAFKRAAASLAPTMLRKIQQMRQGVVGS